MINKLMVIQKILDNGNIDVFQITSNLFQWTFVRDREREVNDREFFPFKLNGRVNILKREPGDETEVLIKDNQIVFSDDYGIPEGTVIAVLFPKNYIPDIIKFKDKPVIPIGLVGQISSMSPGQFEILYNHAEKQCAIIFHIFKGTAFGFKCITKKVSDDVFPNSSKIIKDEDFDVSLSQDFLDVELITTENLKLINETLQQVDLSEIQKTLNDLLKSLKMGEKEQSRTLLQKTGSLLINSSGVVSSLTTISDSYKTGGSAEQFIGRILEYITL